MKVLKVLKVYNKMTKLINMNSIELLFEIKK